ncbi:DUF6520 family protein [Algoriphagus sp. A40]|uniref:DUF6520 family protein n=1 Tax=Algoriphagus sp. A40 TaxID=1945863 RepID=UPI00098712DE|nr:DUF6520 family protein [Algoriphagus sp. A40]OOG69924.1 hypothetical protein B0E43_19635 [Algoriphagus sp. A40]
MIKFLKLLPALAIVLAATLAFAFAPAQTSEYGYDGQNWINVTGLTPGPTTFLCNEDPQVCTRQAANHSAPQVKPGIFVNNMD